MSYIPSSEDFGIRKIQRMFRTLLKKQWHPSRIFHVSRISGCTSLVSKCNITDFYLMASKYLLAGNYDHSLHADVSYFLCFTRKRDVCVTASLVVSLKNVLQRIHLLGSPDNNMELFPAFQPNPAEVQRLTLGEMPNLSRV